MACKLALLVGASICFSHAAVNQRGWKDCKCLQLSDVPDLHANETLQVAYVGEVRSLTVAFGLGSCKGWHGDFVKCLKEPGTSICSRSWCIVHPDCKPSNPIYTLWTKTTVGSSGKLWTYSFQTCGDNDIEGCWPPKTWHKLDGWCDWDATLVSLTWVLCSTVPAVILLFLRMLRLLACLSRCGQGRAKQLVVCMRSWLSWLKPDTNSQIDPVVEEARRLAAEWRIQLSLRFLDLGGTLSCMYFAIVAAYFLVSEDWLQKDPYLRHVTAGATAVRTVLSVPLIELSILCCASLLCEFSPRLGTLKFFDACTIFLGVAGTVRPTFYVIDHDWNYHGQLLWALRVVTGLCWGNSKLHFVFGFTTVAATCAEKLRRDFPASSDISSVAIRELSLYLILCLAVSLSSWSNERSAIFAVESKLSNQQNETITTLLNNMADAVIYLDNQLCLTEPSPKLEALLQASPQSLQKRCFLDLLPASEVERCRSAFAEAPQLGAGCVHTIMVDSNRLLLNVQVFHACLLTASGTTLHIAGIKDYSDEVGQQDSLVQPLGNTPSSSVALRRPGSDSSWSDSSWSDCDYSMDAGKVNHNDLMAWLDTTPGSHLKVISCTDSFAYMLGTKSKNKIRIANYMTVGGFEDIMKWLPSIRADSSATEARPVCLFTRNQDGEDELTRFLVWPQPQSLPSHLNHLTRAPVALKFELAPEGEAF